MAVTLTAAALAAALSTDAPTAARLLPVATALVDRHAPGAPDAIANEAAIRVGRVAVRRAACADRAPLDCRRAATR